MSKEIEIRLSRKSAEELAELDDKLGLNQELSREERIKKYMLPQKALFG